MITGQLQGFLLMVVKLASDIAMLILLIRYVAAPYLYADSGPFLQAINQAAMTMSRPFRRATYWMGFRRRDVSPLVAILVILLLRGVVFALVPASFSRMSLRGEALLVGQQISFTMGCLSLLCLVGLVLFFSVMFAKAGGFFSGVFFRTVDGVAATLFGHVHKAVRLKNLWALLACGLVYICIVYALAVCLILVDIHFPWFWAEGMLALLSTLVWAMIILCIIYIAITWMSLFATPDESNRLWLMLQAMVRPALERTRRLFPWARLGMLDLSPIFFFLGLSLCLALIAFLRGLLDGSHLFPS